MGSVARSRRLADALEREQWRAAAVVVLVEHYGARWRLWLPQETLEHRMAAHLAAFHVERVARYGIWWSRPVRRCARYARWWIRHLAHRQFGARYRLWLYPDEAAGREMTMADAEKRIGEMQAYLRGVGQGVRARRRSERLADAITARHMHDEGFPNETIAETLGVCERTVRRHLSDPLTG